MNEWMTGLTYYKVNKAKPFVLSQFLALEADIFWFCMQFCWSRRILAESLEHFLLCAAGAHLFRRLQIWASLAIILIGHRSITIASKSTPFFFFKENYPILQKIII